MDWKARIRAALSARGADPDDDVAEELAQHARAEYETARADGCTHEEADARVTEFLRHWSADAAALRRRARRPSVIEPPPAEAASPFAGLGHDFRYAGRLLRRQPRYALLVILTMALGIGTTTLLFSVTYGVLMAPLPWPDADRIVVLKETRGGNRPRFGSLSNTAYHAWSEQPSTVDAIAAWSARTATLTGLGEPSPLRVTYASASLFTVLGVHPLAGTLFGPADETSPVIVLSESLWRQRLSADPSVIGRTVHLDRTPHTIVGVLPEGLAYPDSQSRAWVPFRVPAPKGNLLSMFSAVARLRPGVTPAQAAAEGTARGRFAADTGMTTVAIFGNNGPVEISAQPLQEALTADVRRPLVVLLAGVLLLLLTATANIASVQLARATTRVREIAVRAALGAGQARVTRQLLLESLLISLAGGAAGLLLAWTLHGFLQSVLPADFPRLYDLRLSGIVVAVGLLLSIGAGVAFGLAPALRVRRLDLVSTLAQNQNAPSGSGWRSFTSRARMLIMAAQVAIACVLLIGAALLGQSFFAMLTEDRGYDPSGVLTGRVALPASSYSESRRYAIVSGILERLAGTPGVLHASFTSELPLGPGGSTSSFTIPSRTAEGGTITVQASPRVVSPRYFAAAGMRIVAGRGFSDSDTETSPRVYVVNRALARRFLNDDAVGVKVPLAVGYGDVRREAEIVGVVDDVRYVTASEATQPEIYHSYRQFGGTLPVPVVTFVLRSADGDTGALVRPLRTAVADADRMLTADNVLTMEERLLRGLARPRLYALVLGGFALSALLVAAVGLFGVLSYSVAQRSRELAVRTALGARRIDVVKLVFGQTMAITCAGIAAGLVASFAFTRSIAALLHGVTARDTTTFILVPLVLLVVAAAACLPPSLKAAKLDPLRGLRS